MVRFVPVEHDPFAAPTQPRDLPMPPSMLGPNTRYVQVDHDPFADGGLDVGGLPADASPIDYATQSMTAAATGPRPRRPGGGVLEQMQAEGRMAEIEPLPPEPAPRTTPGSFGDMAADAYTSAFGGHDPLGEVFDRIVTPFLPGTPDTQDPAEQQWLDQRGAGERALDTAAFGASLPVRAFTRGQYGAGDIATGLGFPETGERIAAGESDFSRANEDQLAAAQWVGEGALGATGASLQPMAPRPPRARTASELPPERVEPTFDPPPQSPQSRALPPPPQPANLPAPSPSVQPGVPAFGQPGAPVGPSPQVASMPTSNTGRARQYVQTLDELGMPRFGPAIAQAAREGEGMGVLTRMTQNVPLAGRPIERGGAEFYNAATRVADDLAGQYSRTGNPEDAGRVAGGYFERFKNERSIDRDDMASRSDDNIHTLATTPPRDVGSIKTAIDARYEDAWREIPERFRRGGAEEENPRLMSNMAHTRRFLMDVSQDNARMMNRSMARRNRRRGEEEAPAGPGLVRTRQGDIPREAVPFRGGVLGHSVDAILGGNWNGSLQTMRNIRSMVRRNNSRIADNEGNVLSKSQLRQLHGAISRDMTDLMTRIAEAYRSDAAQALARGDQEAATASTDLAGSYLRAAQKMRVADRFTRRYAEVMDNLQAITGANRDIEVIDRVINAAAAGSKANTDMLLSIRRTAPHEILDSIASGVLNKIGQPTGRASAATQEAGWSLGKAVSQWNSMSPRGRQLIWGHRPQLYQQLNKFFKVAEGMAEYEKMVNTSKSGQHVISALVAAGGLTALSSITGITNALLIGAGAYGAARWLTSPAYVAWLTKSLQLQRSIQSGRMRAPAARAAAQRQQNALVKLIKADKSIDPNVAANIVRAIGAAGGEQPTDGAPE